MLTDNTLKLAGRSACLDQIFDVFNFSFGYAFIKRAIDIFGSLILLSASLPLMIIVAILIKITSPGPVIYKQQRCTKGGKVFWLYKFRSMPHNIENGNGPKWGKTDDPRCTNFGRFLRIMLIDELPQLVNILKGEMSLVGPRPERPFFIKQFREKIHNYDLRHAVKAGLTGWAQVNGYRGNTSIVKRVEHDLFYIENRSVLFDIKIILMTPFSIRVSAARKKEKHMPASERRRNEHSYSPSFRAYPCVVCSKSAFSEKVSSF